MKQHHRQSRKQSRRSRNLAGSWLIAGLFCLSSLALSGCPSDDDRTGDASPAPTQAPSAAATTSAKPVAGQIRGIFIYGEDYQVFKACGSKEEVWVQDTPGKDLETRYKALRLMELEPVYVELGGALKPTGKSDGFAAGYKQTLHVSKLQALRPWVSDGSCFETDFVAMGSPPDWTLQILRSGDVYFKSHEGEFPVVDTLAYSPPRQEGNHWRYSFRFRTPDEEQLEADISEESCEHAGQSYAYLAKVQFRGVTYTGCARKLMKKD